MDTLENGSAARIAFFVVVSTFVVACAVWGLARNRLHSATRQSVPEIVQGRRAFVAHAVTNLSAASARVDTAVVGEPALAGSDSERDAMNATREAQRIASVAIDGVRYQAVGYVRDPDRKVVVAVRNDQGSNRWTGWQAYVYDGTAGLPDLGGADEDTHNWVSIGFDAGGTLHLTWDMHNDPLKYRRATAPVDRWEGALTDRLSMLGTNENQVTYVRFHLLDGTLYATFRNGVAGRGDWFFYAYDAQREAWMAGPGLADTEGKLLDGTSDDQNPYLFRDPVVDGDGRIHFVWSWRTSPDVSTNHQVEYARWNGEAYVTTAGSALSVPLREGEAETVDEAGPGEGLEDIGALTVDASGRPHLAYRKDGPNGRMQMFHVWHDGAGWQSTQLTDTDYPSFYALTSDGGMYLSGAAIAPLREDTIAILFTDDADDNHLAAWTATAPFQSWSKSIVYEGRDLGYYEAGIDRGALREQDRLFLPLTPWRNSDPAGGWPFLVVEVFKSSFDVELTRFDVAVEDSVVRLTWETDAETNTVGFDVERRSEASGFEAIGFVEAAGTSDAPQSYEFVDADLPAEAATLSYRLRITHEDGTAVYSSVVRSVLRRREVQLLGNYPNPVHDRSTIAYELAESGQVRITLFNVSGQRVRTLVDAHREAGRHEVEIDVQALASGMYLLRLDADGHSAEGKITVAR